MQACPECDVTHAVERCPHPYQMVRVKFGHNPDQTFLGIYNGTHLWIEYEDTASLFESVWQSFRNSVRHRIRSMEEGYRLPWSTETDPYEIIEVIE